MTTPLTVFLALSAAGGLALLARRMEASRIPGPSECSLAVDAVLAKGTNDTADSVLLKELLTHRDRCQSDAIFVDQARRLMTNVQRPNDARTLLEFAESQRAMKPDEFVAQRAWIDAAESQQAWADGDSARATELFTRANLAANALRTKWPEWSMPYHILEEVNRSGISPTRDAGGANYLQLERAVRAQKLNGAWIRSLYDWQPVVFTFAIASFALLALGAGLSMLIDAREMSGRKTSPVGTAAPGYVELKGTLHLVAGTEAVIGPLTKTPAVWYELQWKSGAKKSKTDHTFSGQIFLLRDLTGEIRVDPVSISVRTRHSTTRFGNSVGEMSRSRTIENLLKEGDVAFALGEVTVSTNANGVTARHLRVAQDGRRLFVSNFNEAQLISMEKIWFALGTTVGVLALVLLAWSYHQRYNITTTPGILL